MAEALRFLHHRHMGLFQTLWRLYLSGILRLVAVVGAATLCGCSFTSFTPSPPSQERPELSLTQIKEPRGVFIVIHGLNQRPSSMDPLCEYLRTLGFHTYRLTLSGHDVRARSTFNADRWQRDIIDSYVTLRVRFPDLPINMAAYSLGGLIATSTLDSKPFFNPARMVLFAPGLSLRPLLRSGVLLEALPAVTIPIPSLAPTSYKRFESIPTFWYQNTLDLYTRTRSLQSPSRLRNIPTIIFVNSKDEIVSDSGIESWISDNGLSQSWKIIPVHRSPLEPSLAEHIVIDEQSLGIAEWARIKKVIREFTAR